MSDHPTEAAPPADLDAEAIDALIFDYYEGTLPTAERARVEAILRARGEPLLPSGDPTSGVVKLRARKVAPPETFDRDVTATIARRSGGRFFGPASVIDRLPLRAIAVVVILVALGLVALWWRSSTGAPSVRRAPGSSEPPGAGQPMVTPP